MNAQLVNAVNLAGDERAQLPGRDPAAAGLRPEPPCGDGLRRDGRGHRPRDLPLSDDTGALFDAKGKLNNWWTPEDLAHFRLVGGARRAVRRVSAPSRTRT